MKDAFKKEFFSRRFLSPNFLRIFSQRRMMIQSRMPTRWSCEPSSRAYASSNQDLEKQMCFFNSQLCTPLPTNMFKCLSHAWTRNSICFAHCVFRELGAFPHRRQCAVVDQCLSGAISHESIRTIRANRMIRANSDIRVIRANRPDALLN